MENEEKSLNKVENIWLKNQYHESWTSRIINDALQEIKNKDQLKSGAEKIRQKGTKTTSKRLFLFL